MGTSKYPPGCEYQKVLAPFVSIMLLADWSELNNRQSMRPSSGCELAAL